MPAILLPRYTETPGPRGQLGQVLRGQITGNPDTFDSTHSSFATLQSAINAGGSARRFLITGGFAITTALTLHNADQVWFDNGVTVTGTIASAFTDGGGAVNNCKIMNGAFSGFTTKAIDNTVGTGWEIANNDISGGVYSLQHFSGAWVHHNKCHDTSDGPISGYQSVNAVVEDNEIGPNVGTANGQKWVGTTGLVVRHNWSHDNDRTGIWMDYHNENFLLEWNLVEDCAQHGIELEANPSNVMVGGSVTRYNIIRNSGHMGIFISGSAKQEVHNNILNGNQQLAQTGLNEAEIILYINKTAHIDSQGSDLANNWIHHNDITTMPSGTNKRGATLQVDADVPDPTPYTSNTKNNRFNFNTYHLGSLLGSGVVFYWNANKSFATWQAVPQDANSTAD